MTNEPSQNHINGYWRLARVLQQVPVSKSTLYSWIASGRFPAPYRFSRVSLWKVEEVVRFMHEIEAGGKPSFEAARCESYSVGLLDNPALHRCPYELETSPEQHAAYSSASDHQGRSRGRGSKGPKGDHKQASVKYRHRLNQGHE